MPEKSLEKFPKLSKKTGQQEDNHVARGQVWKTIHLGISKVNWVAAVDITNKKIGIRMIIRRPWQVCLGIHVFIQNLL